MVAPENEQISINKGENKPNDINDQKEFDLKSTAGISIIDITKNDKHVIDASYITKLEKRYKQIYGLFYTKSSEVENLKDELHKQRKQVEKDGDYIRELQLRIKNLMASATQNIELRMKSIKELR